MSTSDTRLSILRLTSNTKGGMGRRLKENSGVQRDELGIHSGKAGDSATMGERKIEQ
jgi:hypothetical protein